MKLREKFDENITLLNNLPYPSPSLWTQELLFIDHYLYCNYGGLLIDETTFDLSVRDFAFMHDNEFNRLYKALNADYNPIENYDKTIEQAEVEKVGKETSTLTRNGSIDVKTTQKGTLTTTETGKEAVVNSDTLKAKVETVSETEPSENFETNVETSYTNNTESTAVENVEKSVNFEGENFDAGRNAKHMKYREHGNIGVTTTQQMIGSSFDMEAKYNFIKYVCQRFIEENTIGVYEQ